LIPAIETRIGYRFPLLDQTRNIGSVEHPFGYGQGCIEASQGGLRDSMAVAGTAECIRDSGSRFRGWQGPDAGAGATPYYDYLTEVAGYGSGEVTGNQWQGAERMAETQAQ
jgi:hypothetical protein